MHDGLDKIPINKLNFNQLRERVQILQDRYDVLIRRYPQLASVGVGGSSESEGIDWANIVTPLLRAMLNRLQFTVSQNYDELEELDHEPGEKEDKAKIYFYDEKYWYWNGNEWKSTSERDIYSVWQQTPAGAALKGVLELKTDTGGRLTISDSFVRMYPAGSSDPKIQFGYYQDAENPNAVQNNPILILGTGSGTETKEILGYPVRVGQAILLKTAVSVAIGMVSDLGDVRYLELVAQEKEGKMPGLYWHDGETGSEIATRGELAQLDERIKALEAQTE